MATKPLRPWLFLVFVLALALSWSGAAHAVTCTSKRSGDWSNASTWTGCTGGSGTTADTPGPNDAVVILDADNVTVNTSVNVGSIVVKGTLAVAAGMTLTPLPDAIVSGDGTLTGSGTVRVTRITTGSNDFGSQYRVETRFLPDHTVEYAGTAAQVVTARTYDRLTVNNASGVSLAGDTTVSTLLTLTSGNIITGTSTLITSDNCAASVTRISGHVVGNLQKRIPNNASVCTFEIGSGSYYTPVVLTFVTGTKGGSITARTTDGEHGAISESGIDPGKDVNRFWTLATSTVDLPATGYTANFNFINGSPVDIDPGANPGNFVVQRWDGINWIAATSASCTATPSTNVCRRASGVTGFGDFAIGEGRPGFISLPAAFNAFETDTPANKILGRIYTKLADTAFSLDIVALSATRSAVDTDFDESRIKVALLDARDNTGALSTATNCRSTWRPLHEMSLNVTWNSGRARIDLPPLPIAAREVRVWIAFFRGNRIEQGCSTDRFAIRPVAFTRVTASGLITSDGKPLKTGDTFTLEATAALKDAQGNDVPLTGYDNGADATIGNPQVSPSIDNTKVKVASGLIAGVVGGPFSAAAHGVATGKSFFYSEVGHFTLGVNGVFDSSFTAVDQPGDCTPDFSNIPVAGKYGCNFGNASETALIGRFTPDHFEVTVNAPRFSTACEAGGFTYVGQRFVYATAPVITVTARNGNKNGLGNQVTQNYTGSYWKLTNGSLTGKNYAVASGGLDTSSVDGTTPPTIDPVIKDLSNGVGTLSFSSGAANAGFFFTRTSPVAPFNAEIALSINVIDSDGVEAVNNPVRFGTLPSEGIGFSGGKEMRFGRLILGSASGSELLNLQMPIETQFWTGTNFVRNSADSCTTIAANNVSLTAHAGGINPTNMPQTNVFGGAVTNGVGSLRLNKPTPAPSAKGSVNVCVDLGPDSGVVCGAGASANMPWLQGRWGGAAGFNNDPAGRATFGVFRGGPVIYRREMY